MRKKRNKRACKAKEDLRTVRRSRLIFQALPEILNFQFFTKVTLLILAGILGRFASAALSTSSFGVITTANLRQSLLSWQGLLCLFLGAVAICVYTAMDLLAQILLSDEILKAEPAKTFNLIKRGFTAMPKFLSAGGIPVLFFIFLAVPLIGIGFGISLTRSLRIPSFITEVIAFRPVYLVLYLAGNAILMWLCIRYIFTLHGVMIDDMSVKEAKKHSVRLIRANWKSFFGNMIPTLIKATVLNYLVTLVYGALFRYLQNTSFTDPETREFLAIFITFSYVYIAATVAFLISGLVMVRFTELYNRYSGHDTVYRERPRRATYTLKLINWFVVAALLALTARQLARMSGDIFTPSDVGIIAHRAGGTLASENSLDGLEAAIDKGAYGSEIDIQRTADGRYIVNHDSTFKRLAGIDKKPSEMTYDEIRSITFPDTTGNGKTQTVATLEEMLETIKDREILFIELKGETADRQMVDDTVRIVRGMDCVDDVVLISLKYDIINYAETTYPEFETGVLIYGTYGQVNRLNCDYVLLEAESAVPSRCLSLHGSDMKAGVWTLNDEASIDNFINSTVDVIITDNVEGAAAAKEKLQSMRSEDLIKSRLRTDLGFGEVITSVFDSIYLTLDN